MAELPNYTETEEAKFCQAEEYKEKSGSLPGLSPYLAESCLNAILFIGVGGVCDGLGSLLLGDPGVLRGQGAHALLAGWRLICRDRGVGLASTNGTVSSPLFF